MTEWILLVPPGVEVDVRTSGAMTEPVLVTAEQVQTVALAAAKMLEAGIPVDIGAMLVALARGDERSALVERFEPAYVTLAADLHVEWCACGAGYQSELALKRHQAGCGLHQEGFLIPKDRQVDK